MSWSRCTCALYPAMTTTYLPNPAGVHGILPCRAIDGFPLPALWSLGTMICARYLGRWKAPRSTQ